MDIIMIILKFIIGLSFGIVIGLLVYNVLCHIFIVSKDSKKLKELLEREQFIIEKMETTRKTIKHLKEKLEQNEIDMAKCDARINELNKLIEEEEATLWKKL